MTPEAPPLGEEEEEQIIPFLMATHLLGSLSIQIYNDKISAEQYSIHGTLNFSLNLIIWRHTFSSH